MIRSTLLVPSLILALGACQGHASAEECRAMTERYLDLALREAPGAPSLSPAQAAAVRDVQRGLKRAEPSYRRVEDDCASLTLGEVRCALDAKTAAAWESCVHSGDAR